MTFHSSRRHSIRMLAVLGVLVLVGGCASDVPDVHGLDSTTSTTIPDAYADGATIAAPDRSEQCVDVCQVTVTIEPQGQYSLRTADGDNLPDGIAHAGDDVVVVTVDPNAVATWAFAPVTLATVDYDGPTPDCDVCLITATVDTVRQLSFPAARTWSGSTDADGRQVFEAIYEAGEDDRAAALIIDGDQAATPAVTWAWAALDRVEFTQSITTEECGDTCVVKATIDTSKIDASDVVNFSLSWDATGDQPLTGGKATASPLQPLDVEVTSPADVTGIAFVQAGVVTGEFSDIVEVTVARTGT